MSCGCTVITQFENGGHLDFSKPGINSIPYTESPKVLNPSIIRNSVLDYDFDHIWSSYYPK